MIRRTSGICLLLVLLLLLPACALDRPLVERFEQGDWQPEAYRIVLVGGQRAAATVTFVLRFESPAGRRLVVEGVVEIDPQARLIGGHWEEEGGPTSRAGVISSSAVDFFGGQGGRPSLGGQFTLSAEGNPLYRINLPTTRLTSER